MTYLFIPERICWQRRQTLLAHQQIRLLLPEYLVRAYHQVSIILKHDSGLLTPRDLTIQEGKVIELQLPGAKQLRRQRKMRGRTPLQSVVVAG
jgi:hypothetical protein